MNKAGTSSDFSLASPPNQSSLNTPSSSTRSNLSITGIQPLMNASDDYENTIEMNGVLWSPIRIERMLEGAASNNLAMFNIIRVSFNCMAPLSKIDSKWDENLVVEIEGTAVKIEKTTAILEVVRCKSAVPFNLSCQKIENANIECNITISGEECPFCLASGHEKDINDLCLKLLNNPPQRSTNGEVNGDVFKWIFDCQNHINAVLNFVCKDRRVMHQINWTRFCLNVRTSLYAAMALETSNVLFNKISGKSPFTLLGVVFPMRVVSIITDLKNFSKSVIGNNATELHDRAIQGTY